MLSFPSQLLPAFQKWVRYTCIPGRRRGRWSIRVDAIIRDRPSRPAIVRGLNVPGMRDQSSSLPYRHAGHAFTTRQKKKGTSRDYYMRERSPVCGRVNVTIEARDTNEPVRLSKGMLGMV